jgi:hypothetical protein
MGGEIAGRPDGAIARAGAAAGPTDTRVTGAVRGAVDARATRAAARRRPRAREIGHREIGPREIGRCGVGDCHPIGRAPPVGRGILRYGRGRRTSDELQTQGNSQSQSLHHPIFSAVRTVTHRAPERRRRSRRIRPALVAADDSFPSPGALACRPDR